MCVNSLCQMIARQTVFLVGGCETGCRNLLVYEKCACITEVWCW
jgi:hypothetical protein